ncbi:GntR family transcriptional regulator [Rhizobium sp. ICMP 5592]|uniref:GntR family transcriptional regulator n=1 Tax=Rhizobium sp. ICMP 5592 TaxID=2292445 RepID=UPI0012972E73|nr:GntR family transcriptional regulator [Rhizobium sp. ICMP 5592]MQB46173.1 GntR family transcriptional regulator [Rhizobium sp. ICMP 5592]
MAVKGNEVRKSAPELVRDGLREAILAGAYEEGQQLLQDELAEQFGTSRIPIREALRQLEGEGLVELHANKGAVVKGLSVEDVLEMLDIRIALECRALKLAIPNMAVEDLEAAEQILTAYEEISDPAAWGEMNWRFHWTLYCPCDRGKLLAMIESNYGHVSRFTRRQVSLATGKAKPQQDHAELLRLCREGEADAAVALLEKHIEQTQKSLRAAMRRR